MTDHAELNARAARLVGYHQYGKCDDGNTAWCYSPALGAVAYSCSCPRCRDHFPNDGWNPAGNYNHFAEVRRSDAVQAWAGPLRERLSRMDDWWVYALTDLPAALEGLLDAVEADRREGAAEKGERSEP